MKEPVCQAEVMKKGPGVREGRGHINGSTYGSEGLWPSVAEAEHQVI